MRKNITRRIKTWTAAILVAGLLFTNAACGIEGEHGEALSGLEQKDEEEPDVATATTEEPTTEYIPEEYADGENEEFQKFIKDYFEDEVTSDTISYNYTIKNGENFGIAPPEEATLGDPSMTDEALADQKKEMEDFYEELMAFEGQPLNEDEKFTFDCLKTDTELSLHIFDNIYLYEPFSPMRGLQANIPTNFTDYRFDDKSDVEDYIALLNQMRDYFGGYIEWEYVKSEKGYFMSDAVADEVIDQCNEFTADKENNFMIEVFDERIDGLDFLTEEEKADFKEQDKDAVLNSVIPAFQDLCDAITELKGTGKNDKGICFYEGGKDYYKDYLFPSFTGSAKTPDEEIKVMEQRASDLVMDLTMVYYGNPDSYEKYYDEKDEIFKKYDDMKTEELIDYLMDNCMDEFPELDRIGYHANYLDSHMEKIMENTLAYYMSPAIDDQENNIIYVNGAHSDGMWTTLAHEGCPGHMFQNAYFMSTNPNPARIIQGNLGYMEGWAVYSSNQTLKYADLSDLEYGDEYREYERINEDLGYLLYGRIDLGVNYEGWTLEDVGEYMVEQGYSEEFAQDIYTTVTGDPAVYLSYSTSYYEMEELRNKAEAALGDKFDPVEYHKVILEAGPCQYENLAKKVDKYIYDNK